MAGKASLVKKQLSSRSLDAASRLYDPLKKTKSRSELTVSKVQPKLGNGKNETSMDADGRSLSSDRSQRPKRNSLTTAKPLKSKAKKDTNLTSEVSHLKGLKKQINTKTERTLKRFEERVSSFDNSKKNVVNKANVTKEKPIVQVTPVIQEAYPKNDEEEQKLLQKVQVTVPNAPIIRKVKSATSRKPRSPQKSKNKGENTEDDPKVRPSKKSQPKIERATSAGLLIEKRGQSPQKDPSTKEDDINPNFDPENQAIVSGDGWHIVIDKRDGECRSSPPANESSSNSTAINIIKQRFALSPIAEGSLATSISPSPPKPTSPISSLKNDLDLPDLGSLHETIADIPAEDRPVITEAIDMTEFNKDSDTSLLLIPVENANIETTSSNSKEALDPPSALPQVKTPESDDWTSDYVIVESLKEFVQPENIDIHTDTMDEKSQVILDESLDDNLSLSDIIDLEDEEVSSVSSLDENYPDLMQEKLESWMNGMRSRSNLDALVLRDNKKRTSQPKRIKSTHDYLEEGLLPILFEETDHLEIEKNCADDLSDATCSDFNSSPLETVSTTELSNDISAPKKSMQLPKRSISFLHNPDITGTSLASMSSESHLNESLTISNSDEEMYGELEKTLHDLSSSFMTQDDSSEGESTLTSSMDSSPSSHSGSKLTQAALKEHDAWHKDNLDQGLKSHANFFELKNGYNVADRENLHSRTSARTKMTNWSETTTSTLVGELDTAACLGWKRGKELGWGSYGTVFEGLTRDGQLIAVKQVSLNVGNREIAQKEYKQMQEEVEILRGLRHENIVRLLGTNLEQNNVYIFMEHVSGGSIATLLQQFGSLPERIFRKYAKQILVGVQFLHSHSVVHRDIKGSNVMLMTSGVIKLIDFGCAKRLKENTLKRASQDSENSLRSIRGTPYWMAPEVITSEGHGPKSDIWSVGCTVYEMATSKPPLNHLNPHAAIYHIGKGQKIPDLPQEKFSSYTIDFVKKCLTRDPRCRPSANELLQHAFISRGRKYAKHHN